MRRTEFDIVEMNRSLQRTTNISPREIRSFNEARAKIQLDGQ